MKYLIMHGTYGDIESNWFPWLKNELELIGQDVLSFQFPVDDINDAEKEYNSQGQFQPKNQTLTNWIDYFEKNILPSVIDEKFVIIGHSSAPLFILHANKAFDLNIDCSILIAPFNNIEVHQLYDPINSGFYIDEITSEYYNGISSSYVLHSDDDPYVPSESSIKFANDIGASKILVRGGGHMGSIYTKFPLVLELCKTRI